MVDDMNVLDKISRLKFERNWTEYRLSVEANIPQTTISSWYKKDICPSISSLEAVCLAFNITLSEFFSENDEAVCLTESQKQMLDRWNRLNKPQQTAVFALLDSFNS